MNNLQYNLLENQDGATLSIFVDGDLHTILDSHTNFASIISELRESSPSTEKIKRLIDVRKTIQFAYEQLTELVEIRDDQIYFDNEPADPVVSESIMRSIKGEDKADAVALAKFLERLAQNPSNHSKEQLYNWLRDRNFSITEDGMLLAYKGVRTDYKSIHSGSAIVDGVTVSGNIPNKPNTTISMARSEVTDNPAVGCAYGLHVGTFSYAQQWARGGKVLAVLVNPRDTVSVPTDCSAQKMRVSRYRVLDEVFEPINNWFLLSEEMKDIDRDYDASFDWSWDEQEEWDDDDGECECGRC